MPGLTLGTPRGGVCRVLDDQGQHVGNLKSIGGRWKFKAIGYDEDGQVMPGGGPLTAHHDMQFAQLDAAEISVRLLGG